MPISPIKRLFESLTGTRKNTSSAGVAGTSVLPQNNKTKRSAQQKSNAINAAAKESRKAKLAAAKAAEAASATPASATRRKSSRRKKVEKVSEALAYLRSKQKHNISSRIRKNMMAAEEGKTRVKGRSGRGIALMSDDDFIEFAHGLTLDENVFAQHLLSRVNVFEKEGKMIRYINIQRNDIAGGDILSHMRPDMVDGFVGITERLDILKKRAIRLALLHK